MRYRRRRLVENLIMLRCFVLCELVWEGVDLGLVNSLVMRNWIVFKQNIELVVNLLITFLNSEVRWAIGVSYIISVDVVAQFDVLDLLAEIV